MRSRSRSASWAAVAGLVFGLIAAAQGRASEGDPPVVENTVRLELQIAGLGAEGGKIEIKPRTRAASSSPSRRRWPRARGPRS